LHEHFSVLEGELTVVRAGQRSVLHAGESAHIEPGVWHDRWNEAHADAVVRVAVTPGERFYVPWENTEGRAVGQLTALPGARVLHAVEER
jgi:quercetin dioxygenase-like cupin family protein